MTLKIQFGAYDISADPNVDISDWEENSNSRIEEYSIAHRDGAIVDLGRLSPIEIKVKGQVLGSTQAALKNNWDAFLKNILLKKDKLYFHDDRYVEDAQVRAKGNSNSAGLLVIRFNLSFISGKPFWKAVAASQDTKVISSSPTQWAVTMAGSAYAKPKITFAADQGEALNNISFENVTGNKTFSYVGTVASGKSLIIDCDDDELSVKNDGINDMANFTGYFWELLTGANTLKYTGQKCTIVIDFYDRWF